MEVVLWFLALGATAVPIWILWRAGEKAKMLDLRLAQNDGSLLDEKGLIATQMNAVPAGTRITHNAQVVMTPENESQM